MRKVLNAIGLASLFVLIIAVNVLASSYSADLATTSGAIADSAVGGSPASNTADDNNSTLWETTTVASACASTPAYIGQDFGAVKSIRRIYVYMNATTRGITSASLQSSSNNSTWNTVATITLINDGANHSYDVPASASQRYWRIVCNSIPTGAWRVNEIEMQELIEDTPTPTETATITPTASTTPSPTPNYFVEITSTLGAPMHFERAATYGDAISFGGSLLIAAVMLISVIFVYWKRPGT